MRKTTSVHGPGMNLSILNASTVCVDNRSADCFCGFTKGDITKILGRVIRTINSKTISGKRLYTVVVRRQVKLHAVGRLGRSHTKVACRIRHPVVLIGALGRPVKKTIAPGVLEYPEMYIASRTSIRFQHSTVDVGSL